MTTQRWLILATLACTSPVIAAPDNQTPPGLFDPPLAIKRIEGPELSPAQSFECTWYSDFLLRETEIDGPGRGPSYLVAQPARASRLPCAAPHSATDIKLDGGNTAFIGRKGAFFFYDTSDTFGVDPFSIWHAPDGKRLYTDVTTVTAGLTAMSVTDGTLHLTYVRAYAGPCSIPQDGAACWQKALKAGHFVRAIAALPPPIQACAASYRAAKATVSERSIITYAVEMTLTPDGKPTILSRTAPACEPDDN